MKKLQTIPNKKAKKTTKKQFVALAKRVKKSFDEQVQYMKEQNIYENSALAKFLRNTEQ